MKKSVLLVLVVFGLFLWVSPAHATSFSFYSITNNNAVDAAIGEAQLSVDVTAGSSGFVSFTFMNVGLGALSITDVYFDDNQHFEGIQRIVNGSGVDFAAGASPGNLPGGNPVRFVATTALASDSNPPAQPNGVNPGEQLNIILTLAGLNTFSDIIAALGNGDLRIGIHVQGFASGGSESFVNNRNPVPEPATMLLLGSGLMGLAAFGRKRFVKGA